MSKVLSFCEKILNVLDGKCECVYDISLSQPGSLYQRYHIPAALVHSSAVLVFIDFNKGSEVDSESLRMGFRNVLGMLMEKADLSMNSFMFFGIIENESEGNSKLCSFNIYNDRITYFAFDEECNDFVRSVLDELSYRRSIFENEELTDIAFSLSLLTGTNGDVRKDSEGTYYIKKHRRWHLASDYDSDEMFKKTALFGAFGAHKFTEQKRGIGTLYFFTCGFFGIGWLFDCVLMLTGMYRDSEGKYLLPVSDYKSCLLRMLCGLFITVGYIFLYILILNYTGTLLNSVLDESISSNSDSITKFTE